MENKFALNKKQSELVDKFITLVKEMKKANIICYNSKHVDNYESNSAYYDKDELVFINGEHVQNFYICDEYSTNEDLEIPIEQIQSSTHNFIDATIENDDLSDLKNIYFDLKK